MSLTAQLQLARLRGLNPDEAGLGGPLREHLAGALVDGQPEDVTSDLLNLALRGAPEAALSRAIHGETNLPSEETELLCALHHPLSFNLLSNQSLSEALQMQAEDGHPTALLHLIGLLACHSGRHLTAQLRGALLCLSPQHQHLGQVLGQLQGAPGSGPQDTQLRRLVAGLSPSGARRDAWQIGAMWNDYWREAAWHSGQLEAALRPVSSHSAQVWPTPHAAQLRLTRTDEGALWIYDGLDAAPPADNLRPLRPRDETQLRERLLIASVPVPGRHPDPESAWQAALLCAPLPQPALGGEVISAEERLMAATALSPWPEPESPTHPVRLLRHEWRQHDNPAVRQHIRAGLRLAQRLTRIHGGEDSELMREADPILG